MTGAKLDSADLPGAKLIGAHFINAKLAHAYLTGADLPGALLSENMPVPQSWVRDSGSGQLSRANPDAGNSAG
jgi:uncharacterized protein YjbI with pentapeptide repeats